MIAALTVTFPRERGRGGGAPIGPERAEQDARHPFADRGGPLEAPPDRGRCGGMSRAAPPGAAGSSARRCRARQRVESGRRACGRAAAARLECPDQREDGHASVIA